MFEVYYPYSEIILFVSVCILKIVICSSTIKHFFIAIWKDRWKLLYPCYILVIVKLLYM